MYYKCEICGKEFKVSPSRHNRAIQNPKLYTPKACSMVCNRIRLRGINRSPKTQFTTEKVTGENNANWKGDKVGYSALHDWVRRVLGTPMQCENCGTTTHRQFEWANLSGEYKRDISDWARLCKMCHVLIDDSLKNARANHL